MAGCCEEWRWSGMNDENNWEIFVLYRDFFFHHWGVGLLRYYHNGWRFLVPWPASPTNTSWLNPQSNKVIIFSAYIVIRHASWLRKGNIFSFIQAEESHVTVWRKISYLLGSSTRFSTRFVVKRNRNTYETNTRTPISRSSDASADWMLQHDPTNTQPPPSVKGMLEIKVKIPASELPLWRTSQSEIAWRSLPFICGSCKPHIRLYPKLRDPCADAMSGKPSSKKYLWCVDGWAGC